MVVYNGHFGQLRWGQEEAGLRNALKIPHLFFIAVSLACALVTANDILQMSPQISADCITMLQVLARRAALISSVCVLCHEGWVPR